jgi:hypothetical protein
MLGEEAVGLEGRFPEKVFKGMRDMLGMSAAPAAAQAALDRFMLPSTLVPPSAESGQPTLGLLAPEDGTVRTPPPLRPRGAERESWLRPTSSLPKLCSSSSCRAL